MSEQIESPMPPPTPPSSPVELPPTPPNTDSSVSLSPTPTSTPVSIATKPKLPPVSPVSKSAPICSSPTSKSPLSTSPACGRPTLAKIRTLSTGSTSSGDWSSSPSHLSRSFSLSSQNWGRHVILALDSSDHAKHAFDWFLEQIHRPDDMVVIVHCPEAPRLPTFSFKSGIAPPVEEWKKILDEMNERTRKLEDMYETVCIQRKLRYKVRGEAMKNAGEGIIRIAEAEAAEIIVIGSRGMSTMRRALLGSVSDFVVRNSRIPVIMVPKPKKPKQ